MHFCIPSLLAPDPIRVQSCFCCLFWTNRNSMAGTSIFLSISLSNHSYESPLSVNGNIYFYWNYSGRLVYNNTFESFIWLITWKNCRFSCWKVFNSNGSYMSPFINKCASHFCKRPQSKIIDPNFKHSYLTYTQSDKAF